MPIFNYSCSNCGQITEVLVRKSSSKENQLKCEACGGIMEKTLAGSSVNISRFRLNRQKAVTLKRDPPKIPGTRLL